jgi:hypothetical protein
LFPRILPKTKTKMKFSKKEFVLAQEQLKMASARKTRRASLTAVVTRHWKDMKEEFARQKRRWDPHLALFLLGRKFSETTVRKYSLHLLKLFPAEFDEDTAYTHDVIQQIHKLSNISPKVHAALPVTPKEVKMLIGDLTTPEQRAVWQMWTTGSRFADTLAWTRTYQMKEGQHLMKLEQKWSKTDRTGKFPSFKWIVLRTAREKNLWNPHGVSYDRLLYWIKDLCPHLSLHSFRKGAIQFLEQTYEPESIARLTNHRDPKRNPGLTAYEARTHMCPFAKLTMRMSNDLAAAVRV